MFFSCWHYHHFSLRQVFQAKIVGGNGREHVALKRVLMTEDKELPESFVREIKILHSLNHPNIVVLLDIVTNEQVSCVGKYQRDKLKLKDQDMMYKECVKNVTQFFLFVSKVRG